ncbi:MAG: bifunctional 2-polyprenyl-6-hydroxyphenol methylase/3-demethylubiquinol 3-O-methyltransferase UbiG [Gammaproteobacteria bacterium]|nr:bifunctional 2-polyprenyl-6-hydroxyphenol methylase/3-demethylubiquinol 3-O-methyltransferase UbiG [Gammaproteobacteria bacterium]
MNVDPVEIKKFDSLAQRWWDRNGEFRPLHDINEIRVRFISKHTKIPGSTVLDVGCGGGILTESLANLGAIPTGIDPAQGPLTVAKLHAVEMGLQDRIRYLQTTAEELAKDEKQFDVVTAMEIVEHVPDFAETVRALASLTKPGGNVFLSTINRKPIAYVVAILGAEYVLNVLPRGTHEYRKFIKPSELAQAARNAHLSVQRVQGYRYNPIMRSTSLVPDASVNYFLHAQKL